MLRGVCWLTNGPLYMDGKERKKEEADHSRLAGGKFNKQGNLHMRLVLGAARWVDVPTHWPTRILKAYREALMSFSPNGPNITLLSQGCVLEMASSIRIVGGLYIPRAGEEMGSLQLPGPHWWVNHPWHPPDDLLATVCLSSNGHVGKLIKN